MKILLGKRSRNRFGRILLAGFLAGTLSGCIGDYQRSKLAPLRSVAAVSVVGKGPSGNRLASDNPVVLGFVELMNQAFVTNASFAYVPLEQAENNNIFQQFLATLPGGATNSRPVPFSVETMDLGTRAKLCTDLRVDSLLAVEFTVSYTNANGIDLFQTLMKSHLYVPGRTAAVWNDATYGDQNAVLSKAIASAPRKVADELTRVLRVSRGEISPSFFEVAALGEWGVFFEWYAMGVSIFFGLVCWVLARFFAAWAKRNEYGAGRISSILLKCGGIYFLYCFLKALF